MYLKFEKGFINTILPWSVLSLFKAGSSNLSLMFFKDGVGQILGTRQG